MSAALGAKTATHVGTYLSLTDAEVLALDYALDMAFEDMQADRARYRAQLRDGCPMRRASAKIHALAQKASARKKAKGSGNDKKGKDE